MIELVDDPSLPCSGCMTVEYDEDEPWDESKWVAYDYVDGELVVIDRCYKYIHRRCQEMIDAYVDEHRDDPT